MFFLQTGSPHKSTFYTFKGLLHLHDVLRPLSAEQERGSGKALEVVPELPGSKGIPGTGDVYTTHDASADGELEEKAG